MITEDLDMLLFGCVSLHELCIWEGNSLRVFPQLAQGVQIRIHVLMSQDHVCFCNLFAIKFDTGVSSTRCGLHCGTVWSGCSACLPQQGWHCSDYHHWGLGPAALWLWKGESDQNLPFSNIKTFLKISSTKLYHFNFYGAINLLNVKCIKYTVLCRFCSTAYICTCMCAHMCVCLQNRWRPEAVL